MSPGFLKLLRRTASDTGRFPLAANAANSVGGFPRDRSAFTLLEILATVAIVVTLALLLLPSVRRLTAQAQGVECLNNQSAWIKGLHLYLADNNNRLPVSAYNVGSSVDATDALFPYMGKATKAEAWKSFFCPTRKLASSGASQVSLWGTYAFNAFVSELSTTALPDKSKLIYITDGIDGSRWASFSILTGTGPKSYAEGVARPHNGRVNVTYLDGHSEATSVSSLTWASFTRGTPVYFSAHENRQISSENYDK